MRLLEPAPVHSPDPGSAPGGGDPGAAAREGEPERYLAALLAPRPRRDALLALAAFSAQVRRIPLLVHEPAMGDIRRQWWRDALAMPLPLRAGHPDADAVRAAAHSYALPGDLLAGVIDAHAGYPGNEAPLGEAELGAYFWGTEGALFALAARVQGAPADAATLRGCRTAGEAYGRVRMLVELPRLLAAGRVAPAASALAGAGSSLEELHAEAAAPKIEALLAAQATLIRDSLRSARRFAHGLPRPARVAFLPLALVEPYVRAFERAGARRYLSEGADIGPLARVSRIAAAHVFGRP
jgi:phytoene synthase